MGRFSAIIAQFFVAITSWSFAHRWLAMLTTGLLLLASVVGLSRLRMETSTLGLFHSSDPARVAYEQFKHDFANDELLLIMVEPEEVWDRKFLRDLQDVHRQLEERVPHLAEIYSLVNARVTRGEEDGLVVEDLLREIPKDAVAMAAFRQRVLGNPLYVGTLVSANGAHTLIVLEPAVQRQDLADAEVDVPQYREMLSAARAVLQPLQDRGVIVHYSGNPMVELMLFDAMLADTERLVPLVGLIIVLVLILLFRRPSGVLAPLAVVAAAALSTLGVMGALGVPLTNVTTIVPTFVLVVGIADSVHILTLFFRHHCHGTDKQTAVRQAYLHAGPPVLLTSLTTAAGLVSFVTADVAWVAHLGMMAPVGVVLALFYTAFFLPALLAILPIRARQQAEDRGRAGALLVRLGKWSTEHSLLVVGLWGVLLAVSSLGLARVQLSQNGMKWFAPDHPLRNATEAIDQAMGGTLTIEVLIDTGRVDGVVDAGFLAELERSGKWLQEYARGPVIIGKALSVTTALKETHRALNEDRASFYRVPETNALVAQELLLFEMAGPDELERVVSDDRQVARLTLNAPFADGIAFTDAIADIKVHLAERFPDCAITVTGITNLFVQTVRNILTSMSKSYPFALLVITILMVTLLGHVRIGLLSMVPNLTPILIVVGLMGWVDIPFDFSTMTVGSLALGLVVDDTIHFLHTFNRGREHTGSVEGGVRFTMETTGRAMLVTSLTLTAGFLAYTQAELENLWNFGVLTSAIIMLALLADFTLVPALLAIRRR